ncbi:MAG: hypothetical protein WDA11_10400 [Thiohalomonadaceae bacterium]
MPPSPSKSQILSEIAHYQAQLAKLPLQSDNPDDLIAREIFEGLLQSRREDLKRREQQQRS